MSRIRVLFREGRRLFARELNEIQDVLLEQQTRVFSKLFGRFRILKGLRLRPLDGERFILSAGTLWVVLDGVGHFVSVKEQVVQSRRIGFEFEVEDREVDENAALPILRFSSARRKTISARVVDEGPFPLRLEREKPELNLQELGDSFVDSGCFVIDRGNSLWISPGRAWIGGKHVEFRGVSLPRVPGFILLSESNIRSGLTIRPDELALGEWDGAFNEFSVRKTSIESAIAAVESLRSLRREISQSLLELGASTRASVSADPLDSDSTSPLFSSVWDEVERKMRSGLRGQSVQLTAATGLQLAGIIAGEWWVPRSIEIPTPVPEPTTTIAISRSDSPRIEISWNKATRDIPAETRLLYASLSITFLSIRVKGFGFAPGEYTVLLGGTQVPDFISTQRSFEGGVVPEPNGTFELELSVRSDLANSILSVGPASAAFNSFPSTSQSAGTVALVFDSPGRMITAAQLLFRRAPLSGTLDLVSIVNGVPGETLAHAPLSIVSSSPDGSFTSRAVFSRPIWLGEGRFALLLAPTSYCELFVSVPGQPALNRGRAAFASQFTGLRFNGSWSSGPTPCIAPIFTRPVELVSRATFRLETEEPLVSVFPQLSRQCPPGTSLSFFIRQGTQFVGLSGRENIAAAKSNEFQVEFESTPWAMPTLRATDSRLLGFAHQPVSYWVSRSREVDPFNFIEVDVDPSTPGATEFLVAVSSNDGQTWEELTREGFTREGFTWSRLLDTSIRRVRADGSTVSEIRRSWKLRFEMRVDPESNEFVSFERFAVRTSLR